MIKVAYTFLGVFISAFFSLFLAQPTRRGAKGGALDKPNIFFIINRDGTQKCVYSQSVMCSFPVSTASRFSLCFGPNFPGEWFLFFFRLLPFLGFFFRLVYIAGEQTIINGTIWYSYYTFDLLFFWSVRAFSGIIYTRTAGRRGFFCCGGRKTKHCGCYCCG